jgi:hypothetical protein
MGYDDREPNLLGNEEISSAIHTLPLPAIHVPIPVPALVSLLTAQYMASGEMSFTTSR